MTFVATVDKRNAEDSDMSLENVAEEDQDVNNNSLFEKKDLNLLMR